MPFRPVEAFKKALALASAVLAVTTLSSCSGDQVENTPPEVDTSEPNSPAVICLPTAGDDCEKMLPPDYITDTYSVSVLLSEENRQKAIDFCTEEAGVDSWWVSQAKVVTRKNGSTDYFINGGCEDINEGKIITELTHRVEVTGVTGTPPSRGVSIGSESELGQANAQMFQQYVELRQTLRDTIISANLSAPTVN